MTPVYIIFRYCIDLRPLQDLGWPTRRKRLLMVAIRKETLVWLGPTTSETLEADFKNFFARRCCVDGSVFAGLDSEDNIAEHRFSRGRAGIDKSMVMHTELKAMFSPPGRRRAHRYMHKFKHFAGSISNSMVFRQFEDPEQKVSCWPLATYITTWL